MFLITFVKLIDQTGNHLDASSYVSIYLHLFMHLFTHGSLQLVMHLNEFLMHLNEFYYASEWIFHAYFHVYWYASFLCIFLLIFLYICLCILYASYDLIFKLMTCFKKCDGHIYIRTALYRVASQLKTYINALLECNLNER